MNRFLQFLGFRLAIGIFFSVLSGFTVLSGGAGTVLNLLGPRTQAAPANPWSNEPAPASNAGAEAVPGGARMDVLGAVHAVSRASAEMDAAMREQAEREREWDRRRQLATFGRPGGQ